MGNPGFPRVGDPVYNTVDFRAIPGCQIRPRQHLPALSGTASWPGSPPFVALPPETRLPLRDQASLSETRLPSQGGDFHSETPADHGRLVHRLSATMPYTSPAPGYPGPVLSVQQ